MEKLDSNGKKELMHLHLLTDVRSAPPQFAGGPAETGKRVRYIRLAAVWFQGAGLYRDWLFKVSAFTVFLCYADVLTEFR